MWPALSFESRSMTTVSSFLAITASLGCAAQSVLPACMPAMLSVLFSLCAGRCRRGSCQWLSRPRRCAFDLAALVEQRAEGAEQLEVYEVGVTVRAQVRSCCARPPCLSARCPTPLSEFRNRLRLPPARRLPISMTQTLTGAIFFPLSYMILYMYDEKAEL